jgi:hypothetical protein
MRGLTPVLACALGTVFAADPAPEHLAPVETLAPAAKPAETARQNTLAEMRARRIVPADAAQWTSEDAELLERMRTAESRDAVALLRRKAEYSPSFVVAYRSAGSSFAVRRLTKAGFEAWLSLRSQDAIDYFEEKGADAKWVFKLVSMEGKALFDGSGRLTPAGQRVYDRALLKLPVWWKTPVGEVFGTRPPPRTDAPLPPPRQPAAPSARPRPASYPRREAPAVQGRPTAPAEPKPEEKKAPEAKEPGAGYEEPSAAQPPQR